MCKLITVIVCYSSSRSRSHLPSHMTEPKHLQSHEWCLQIPARHYHLMLLMCMIAMLNGMIESCRWGTSSLLIQDFLHATCQHPSSVNNNNAAEKQSPCNAHYEVWIVFVLLEPAQRGQGCHGLQARVQS